MIRKRFDGVASCMCIYIYLSLSLSLSLYLSIYLSLCIHTEGFIGLCAGFTGLHAGWREDETRVSAQILVNFTYNSNQGTYKLTY